jgi:hypothetical protein
MLAVWVCVLPLLQDGAVPVESDDALLDCAALPRQRECA